MPSGIDLSTIGLDDLLVTGPGFNDSNNRPTSFTTESITRDDELTVEVKYKFTRPGGLGPMFTMCSSSSGASRMSKEMQSTSAESRKQPARRALRF